MEILVGKTAGFCAGVINAVSKTEAELRKNKKLYCLGELTHNSVVMENLKQNGLNVIEQLEEVPSGENVVIRAHGVPPEIYEQAKQKNINLIDLTCPKV